jgi:hypothetical protein
MTMDGGTTWTPVTVTAGWTPVEIPTQTLANPVVGFRIVTSGNAVAIDMVQNEDGNYRTTPMPATSASTVRNTDALSANTSVFNWSNSTATLYMKHMFWDHLDNHTFWGQDGRYIEGSQYGTSAMLVADNSGGAGSVTHAGGPPTPLTAVKSVFASALNDWALCVNGGAIATDNTTTAGGAVPIMYIANLWNGYGAFAGWMFEGSILPRRMNNADMVTKTT